MMKLAAGILIGAVLAGVGVASATTSAGSVSGCHDTSFSGTQERAAVLPDGSPGHQLRSYSGTAHRCYGAWGPVMYGSP